MHWRSAAEPAMLPTARARATPQPCDSARSADHSPLRRYGAAGARVVGLVRVAPRLRVACATSVPHHDDDADHCSRHEVVMLTRASRDKQIVLASAPEFAR